MPHMLCYEYGYGPVVTLSDTWAEMIVGCIIVVLIEVAAWYWKAVFHLPIVLLYYHEPGFQQEVGFILRISCGPLLAGVRLFALWISQRRVPKFGDCLVLLTVVIYGFGTTALSLVSPWSLTQKSDRNPMVLASGNGHSRIWVEYSDPNSPYDYMPGVSDENMLNKSLAGEADYRNCYEGTSHPQCKYLSTPRLFWKDFRGLPCPFVDKTVCYSGPHTAYRLETDPISFRYLGFNIKEDVTLKRRTTCVPLSYYHWAIRIDGEIFVVDGKSFVNFGRENSNAQANFVVGDLKGQGVNDYILRVKQFYHDSKMLDRRLDLADTPGDWSLILINAMGITFETMANDPVFIVNKTQPIKLADMIRKMKGLPITPKYMTDTFGVVSCIDQYEVCLQSLSKCTGLRPLSKFGEDMDVKLWKDHDKNSTHSLEVQAALHALYQPIKLSSIGQVLGSLGASAMAIRRTGLINHEYQRRVEDDSWMKEIEKWFGLGLAAMQVAVAESMIRDGSKQNLAALVDVLEQTPKIKRQIEQLILYKDGEYSNIKGWGLLATLVVITVGGLLRALNRPFIHWIVRKEWLHRSHVEALDEKLLEDGWEVYFGTGIRFLGRMLLAGVAYFCTGIRFAGGKLLAGILFLGGKFVTGIGEIRTRWQSSQTWRRDTRQAIVGKARWIVEKGLVGIVSLLSYVGKFMSRSLQALRKLGSRGRTGGDEIAGAIQL